MIRALILGLLTVSCATQKPQLGYVIVETDHSVDVWTCNYITDHGGYVTDTGIYIMNTTNLR